MKKIVNQMLLKFESRSNNESFARQTVAGFVAQLDPTLDEINDIKTVVSEAVTNCVVHAYPDKLGFIHITSKIFDDNSVEIIVKDNGNGICNIEKAKEPMFTTGGSERSGMGFTIMESFMDKLKIKSVIGKGTTVILNKRISMRLSGLR